MKLRFASCAITIFQKSLGRPYQSSQKCPLKSGGKNCAPYLTFRAKMSIEKWEGQINAEIELSESFPIRIR